MYSEREKRLHIVELQKYLLGIGFDIFPDGVYGEETKKAVSDFQRANGLPVTGAADLETWEEITAAYRADQAKKRTLSQKLRTTNHIIIQQKNGGLTEEMRRKADELKQMYDNF